MNIFEFAMQMEKDGESYYRELAGKAPNEGLKNILNMLANDEVKHFNTLEAMKKDAQPEMGETQVLSGAKNIFAKMREEQAMIDPQISQKALYEKALDNERVSREFYAQKSNEVADPSHKDILLRIAEEEKKHYFLIEQIIEFISRPKQWVENAEFHHLEEY